MTEFTNRVPQKPAPSRRRCVRTIILAVLRHAGSDSARWRVVPSRWSSPRYSMGSVRYSKGLERLSLSRLDGDRTVGARGVPLAHGNGKPAFDRPVDTVRHAVDSFAGEVMLPLAVIFAGIAVTSAIIYAARTIASAIARQPPNAGATTSCLVRPRRHHGPARACRSSRPAFPLRWRRTWRWARPSWPSPMGGGGGRR